MKRSLAALLALLLCLTLCFVGCNSEEPEATDPKPTEAPKDDNSNNNSNNNGNSNNGNNENNEPETPEEPEANITKDVVINNISAIDLLELLAAVTEGENSELVDSVVDIYAGGSMDTAGMMANIANQLQLQAGANLSMTQDGETYTTVVSIKDGLLYSKNSDGADYVDETYIYIGGETPVVFHKGEDGEWVITSDDETEGGNSEPEFTDNSDLVPTPYTSGEVVEDEPVDPIAMLKDLAEQVVIPELKAELLTEKDGMIIISNEYFLDIIEANAELIAGGELTEEELADGMASAKEGIDAFGLEVAFGGNDKAITKISVKVNPDDSQLGQEIKEDLRYVSFVAEATDDGEQFKSMELKVGTPGYDYADGKDNVIETAFAIEMILDEENAFAGMKLSANVYSYSTMGDSSVNSSGLQVSNDTTEEYNTKIDILLDLTKLGEVGETVASIKSTTTLTRKADIRVEVVDNDWDNATRTLVKEYTEAELKAEEDYQSIIDLSAKATSDTGLKIAGEVEGVTIDGDADLSAAFNFPTELPEIVENYLAENAE